MQDAFNRTLVAGGRVAYVYGRYNTLYVGIVTRFTPKRIVVREQLSDGSTSTWDTHRPPDQVCMLEGNMVAPDGPKDYWGEDPEFPPDYWRYEVQNNDTRESYWDWVKGQKEQRALDEE